MSYVFKKPCAHVRAENWLLAIAIIPIVHPIIDFFFNSSPQNRFHSITCLAIGHFWPVLARESKKWSLIVCRVYFGSLFCIFSSIYLGNQIGLHFIWFVFFHAFSTSKGLDELIFVLLMSAPPPWWISPLSPKLATALISVKASNFSK